MYSNPLIKCFLLSVCINAWSTPVAALDLSPRIPKENRDWIEYIVTEHYHSCLEDQPAGTDLSTVELKVSSDSIYQIPYKADGSLATVFIESGISCTGVGSGWAGSGGTTVYVIAEGLLFEGRGWQAQSVTIGGWSSPVILIPKAGAECNEEGNEYASLPNASPCVSAAIWDDSMKVFNSTDQVLQLSRLNP
jgi:hypothetical protein